MLPDEQLKAYEDVYDAARKNAILEPKTTFMIQLAAAMALGCYPRMQHYFGVAKENGLANEETGAVPSIAMAVSAGKVRAQFRDARIAAKKAVRKMTSAKFDVYGRKVTVESTENGWRVWHHGADGKRRLADDIPIPRQLKPEEIELYLADLCHEWASPEHTKVKRLQGPAR